MAQPSAELLADARRQLVPVDGFELTTFASRGRRSEAEPLAARAERAWRWLGASARPCFPPPVLLVLDSHDWDDFAPMPVYGMPQAWSDRLVVPATESALFDDFTRTLLALLSDARRREVSDVVGVPPAIGRGIAGLVVAHEIGHYFHEFDDATLSTELARAWVAELFANVAMVGYLAECEPWELRPLLTICEATAAARQTPWESDRIEAMGDGTPSGYVWAELLLILVARRIWEAAGSSAFAFFRENLRDPSSSDSDILASFRALDEGVAESLARWPLVSRR